MKETKNRKWLVGAAIVVIVLILVGLGIQRINTANAAAANLQTVPVQRGTLVATVNAAGNVQAHTELNLGFQAAGQVSKIDVNVGDHVNAGQVLAELDPADLALQVQSSEAALQSAQANLAQVKRGPDPNDIAAAKAKLDAARKGAPTAAEIADARAKLQAAKQNLLDVQNGVDPITKAKQALDQAKNNLWSAQINRDGIQAQYDNGRVGKYQLDSANLQIANAELAVEQAQQAYNEAVANKTNTPLAQAQSQVKDAQAALDNLLNSTNPQDVAAAEANLKKVSEGPTAEDLAVAEANVKTAQANLEQAQLKLKNAQLIAPFDGTVTAVNIEVGQQVTTTTSAIGLTDLGHLEIDVNVDEIDFPKLKVDQEAQITLDALPGQILAGKVTQIAPSAVIQQGVVNYPVVVALTNPGPAVKPGMTANVSIIVERKTNVLLVPNRAIHVQGRQHFVTVDNQGQLIQVPVQTGLTSDTQTEIVSGLKAGDEVVLDAPTPSSSTGGFRGGFGGPGFGGPPGR